MTYHDYFLIFNWYSKEGDAGDFVMMLLKVGVAAKLVELSSQWFLCIELVWESLQVQCSCSNGTLTARSDVSGNQQDVKIHWPQTESEGKSCKLLISTSTLVLIMWADRRQHTWDKIILSASLIVGWQAW